MAGYVIADIEVKDAAQFEDYRRMAQATIERYGGQYLVRGGQCTTLEGDWQPRRLVVLRFESYQRALEWYHSPEYRDALELRKRITDSRLIIVEGV